MPCMIVRICGKGKHPFRS